MSDPGVWRVRTTDGDVMTLPPYYDSFGSGTTLLTCIAVEGFSSRRGRNVWVHRPHIVYAWRVEIAS